MFIHPAATHGYKALDKSAKVHFFSLGLSFFRLLKEKSTNIKFCLQMLPNELIKPFRFIFFKRFSCRYS